MSTYTTNYNLEKPDASDDFGDFRANYNSNMDIIDANLGGGGGSVTDVEVNGVSVVVGGVAQVTVPTQTSDLNNDSDFVSDASYVHTDNNFSNADVTKLSGIEAGAEVNVQADWNEADNTADDYIKNKPNLATVATSGSYTDLSNTPTIPDELADLADDSTHRVVTDTQISTWNGKQDDVCLSVVDGKVCITYTV